MSSGTRGGIIWYALLRLVAFAVPLAILLALGVGEWIAVLLAALIGLGVSLLALRRQRDAVAAGIDARRRGRRPASTEQSDEDAEDGEAPRA